VILPDTPIGQYWVRAIDTDTNEQGAFCELETDNAIVAAQSLVAFVISTREQPS
jgi:glycogen operon protein